MKQKEKEEMKLSETIVYCNKCKKNLILRELNKNEWDEWVKEGSFICSSCINKEMFRESK